MSIQPLSIGGVHIYPPVLQAPMAGVADQTFRVLNRRHGCPLVCAEMISDKALTYGSKVTLEMLRVDEDERPISVQIFGSEALVMGNAARMVAEIARPEIIDINMGCPAPKIIKNREGCALMRDLPLASEIIRRVVSELRGFNIPVTVKMRKGWGPDEITVFELAKIAENEGAAAITVHGRTRDQFYSGQADWDIIGEVKRRAGIPVIGNGDVKSPEDALAMINQTGCDGVMIGRASLGNPWIFGRICRYLDKGELVSEPDCHERLYTALQHAQMLVREKGEYTGVREMRKHLAWYIKGLPGAAKIREKVNSVSSLIEIENLVNGYLDNLCK